jgi:hypothetical protein
LAVHHAGSFCLFGWIVNGWKKCDRDCLPLEAMQNLALYQFFKYASWNFDLIEKVLDVGEG